MSSKCNQQNIWLIEAVKQVKQHTNKDCVIVDVSAEVNDAHKPNYIAVKVVGESVYYKLFDRDSVLNIHDSDICYTGEIPEQFTDVDVNINKYIIDLITDTDFLPELIFVSEKFVCVEWYHDYQNVKPSDLIKNYSTIELSLSLGTEQDIIITDLMRDINTRIQKFHNDNKKDLEWVDPIKYKFDPRIVDCLNPASSSPTEDLKHATVTMDRLELLRNFHVKKDSNGDVIDWKYTGLSRLTIGPPNVIYFVDDVKLGAITDIVDYKGNCLIYYKGVYYNINNA